MGRLMTALWIILAVIVVGMGYIRLAPSDPARWHVAPRVAEDETLMGGVKRQVPSDHGALGQLDMIIRQTPRTEVLAGSVEEGMITYVTRTPLMGFPDYTTVQQEGDVLKIYGRSRFGRSDLGVNAKRVDAWLAQLRQISGGGEA